MRKQYKHEPAVRIIWNVTYTTRLRAQITFNFSAQIEMPESLFVLLKNMLKQNIC